MAKYGPYPGGTLGAPHGGGGPGGGGHGGGGHGGGGHGGGGHTHPITRSFRSGGRRGSWWDYTWSPDVVIVTTAPCTTWGDPIEMPISMRNLASSVLDASGMRPTTVRGPDGAIYLFSLENGMPTARPCAA